MCAHLLPTDKPINTGTHPLNHQNWFYMIHYISSQQIEPFPSILNYTLHRTIMSIWCNSRSMFHPNPFDHKLWSNSAYGGRNSPGLVNLGNKAFSSYNALRLRSNVNILCSCNRNNWAIMLQSTGIHGLLNKIVSEPWVSFLNEFKREEKKLEPIFLRESYSQQHRDNH